MLEEFSSRGAWLKARLKYITSTELPALFGITKYGQSEFGLFCLKSQLVPSEYLEEDERMMWGLALQEVIAKTAAHKFGWGLLPTAKEWSLYCDSENKIASSIDYIIESKGEKSLLEIKNVDALVFAKDWEADEHGNYEAPLHIELQLQHQMLCTGIESAILCALVGGNRLVTLKRRPNEKLQELVKQRVGEFWDSVKRKMKPELKPVDLEWVRRLYSAIGTEVVQASGSAEEIAFNLRVETQKKKEAENRCKHLKSQLLDEVGNAKKMLGKDWTLTRSEVAEREITYVRKAYTTDRITWK